MRSAPWLRARGPVRYCRRPLLPSCQSGRAGLVVDYDGHGSHGVGRVEGPGQERLHREVLVRLVVVLLQPHLRRCDALSPLFRRSGEMVRRRHRTASTMTVVASFCEARHASAAHSLTLRLTVALGSLAECAPATCQ